MRRIKRFFAIAALAVLAFVAAYAILNRGNQHRQIDTSGEIVLASDQGSTGKSHLFLIGSDATGLKQITFGNENDTEPAFSPDGSQIAFISDKSGAPQVFLMDADGQSAHAITVGTDAKSKPQFSPDGSRIAYLSRGELSVIQMSTGATAQILPSEEAAVSSTTEKLAQSARAPVVDYRWSPTSDSGKAQIAAVQETPDGNFQTVCLIPATGGAPNIILGAQSVSAAWSPDGSQLAVAVVGAGDGQAGKTVSGIILFSGDGTPVRQPPLAFVPGDTAGPQQVCYSPDNVHLAFTLMRQTQVGALMPAGIGVTALTPGDPVHILVQGSGSEPQISPDSSTMMFYAPDPKVQSRRDVYLLSPTVGHPVTLPLNGTISSARWSPSIRKKS